MKRVNKFYLKYILVLLMIFSISGFAISLDDEAEDIEDVEYYLEKANNSANNGNFSEAYNYLKEAKAYGVEEEQIKKSENFITSKENAHLEKLERERQANLNASGNKNSSINCNTVMNDIGLYNYCKTGNCNSLNGDYKVWNLCKNDNYQNLDYYLYDYLKTGQHLGFPSFKASKGAEKNAGSYADRKRFVIYYLRGYIDRLY